MNESEVGNLLRLSQAAAITFAAWQAADGIFPEPQYDDFLRVMDELESFLVCVQKQEGK